MALLKMVKMANLCLSACCRKCFPSGRKTGRRDPDCTKMADGGVVPPDVEDAEKRACSSSKREARTISLLHTEAAHPLHKKLQLLACVLSANRSKQEEFRVRLSKLSGHPGDNQQNSSMPPTSPDGTSSAFNASVIPLVQL